MDKTEIEYYFLKISNKPCWNVQKGIGSFLTFEFGEPKIEFTEPKIWKHLKYPFNQSQRRRVFFKGTEKLWIYCVDWKIYMNGVEVAYNESDDTQINNGTKLLNGQILNEVEIDCQNGMTKFLFDLGGELVTCNQTHQDRDEAWMLFADERVLTMNNIGQFNLCDLNYVTSDEDFVDLGDRLIRIIL